jgi:hypothetical protein
MASLPCRTASTQESRALADYLSIGDRYSAQTNFDSKNTIGGRLRVNRAHERCAAFLSTVIRRQQWQIGDSLLNSKFGRPTRPRKDASDRWVSDFPSAALLLPLWGHRTSRAFYCPSPQGPRRNSPLDQRYLRIAWLTRPCGSAKGRDNATRALRTSTYLLGVLTDAAVLLFPSGNYLALGGPYVLIPCDRSPRPLRRTVGGRPSPVAVAT